MECYRRGAGNYLEIQLGNDLLIVTDFARQEKL